MTRICLLVEIDTEDGARDSRASTTPTAIRDEVETILFNEYWRPRVELTAFEPAEDPVPEDVKQAAKDLFTLDRVLSEIEVELATQTYNITTENSRYKIVLNVDGTGNITRLGGSSPYVPPDIASRPNDGVAYFFTDGRFEDASKSLGWASWPPREVFVCNGHIRRTSPIHEKQLVS